jgi:hemerythrin superfamily protein
MLLADHHTVRQLFRTYEAATDPHTKQQLAAQVFVELDTHAQLEETVFYPAFEEQADAEGKQLVAASREAHQTVTDLLAELQALDADDPEFAAMFQELRENVEHHADEEEAEMFPRAEAALEEQLEDLLTEMQELKRQLQTP